MAVIVTLLFFFLSLILHTVDIGYLEFSLCPTFYLVPSALSFTSLINPFSISIPAISNFHYGEQFSWPLQSFLGLFPSTVSNIWIGTKHPYVLSFLSTTQKIYTTPINSVSSINVYQTKPWKVLRGVGEHSKIRMIDVAAANAVGEKLQCLWLENLGCLKDVKSLLCLYRSQQKSWKNSALFEECSLYIFTTKHNLYHKGLKN